MLLICLISLIIINFVNANDPVITVQTTYGQIQGHVHKLADNQEIDVFYGIPFARAKRFERPEPPEALTGIRAAFDRPPACIPHARHDQNGSISTSEDCLFLNVFAPHRSSPDESALFPVLFVIHGGAFEMGSSLIYQNLDIIGPRFVAKTEDGQGIVFVSIHYRLGVMGFATTEDDEMPGNLGIWDQIAALRYVQDNIHAFGGDPSRVTVYGYSAGSGSTALLSISPKSRDLFQQAIRMSGSLLSGSGSGTFVANATRELAKAAGCPPSESVKKCLSKITVEEMFDAMEKIGPAPLAVNIAKFGPNCRDCELFPEDYPQLMANSPPKKMIMGFNELDFLLFGLIYPLNGSISLLALTDEQIANYGQKSFEQFVREYVVKPEWMGPDTDLVRGEIVDFYVNKYRPKAVKDRKFYLLLYTMLLSDLMDTAPTMMEAEIRCNTGWPIFLYENIHYNPAIMPNRSIIQAAYHGFDHSLIFSNESTELYQNDRLVSDYLVEAIRNFVIKGDPSTASVKWSPLPKFALDEAESISHLQIKAPKSEEKMGMEGELKRARFWMELAKKYQKFDLVRNIYNKNEEDDETNSFDGNLYNLAILAFSIVLIFAMMK